MTTKSTRKAFFGVSALLVLLSLGSSTWAQTEEPKALSILVTNDDGIEAPGLAALYEELGSIGRVTVIAPSEDRSGVGQAITIRTPLRLQQIVKDGRLFGYALNGTPADCVKFGLNKLLKERPDLVISGINRGANVGLAVFYSGTVAGAREGAILGIPSIAVSLASTGGETPDYRFAARFTKNLALQVRQKGLPAGVLLNVNVPGKGADEIKGVAITRQGLERFPFEYEERQDPGKRPYYWLALRFHLFEPEADSDAGMLARDMVSVTPLQLDLTRNDAIQNLRQWKFE